jgi:hypothetical protein
METISHVDLPSRHGNSRIASVAIQQADRREEVEHHRRAIAGQVDDPLGGIQ